MQKLAMVVLLALSSTALAGNQFAPEVYVTTDEFRRHVYSFAYGSLAGTAASADDVQYISCGAYRYSADGSVFQYGFCMAMDADHNAAACYTNDAEMIEIMSSINETSHVTFTGTDGLCTTVYVTQTSQSL